MLPAASSNRGGRRLLAIGHWQILIVTDALEGIESGLSVAVAMIVLQKHSLLESALWVKVIKREVLRRPERC